METFLRLGCALLFFLVMIGWEILSPRRVLIETRKRRWSINLGLAALNMLMMRITVGGIAYLAAVFTTQQHIGLLNQFASPIWLKILLTVLCLDFAIYVQHILAHKWVWLWRLHQVHHSDMEIDATTAVRFHPLEIFLSMIYKVICILLLGANPFAVIGFEIILNAAATFNHGNVYIPTKLEKIIRCLLITPDMHRIHHSVIRQETNSNYGFFLSCWDRLCGTYTKQAQLSQIEMQIGLAGFRQAEELSFYCLLMMPFQALRKH